MTTIEITHTRAEGTTVEGTSRGDKATEQLKKRDYGRSGRLAFKWSRYRGCWYLPHSRDKQADRYSIDLLAERLRGAGFEVTVTVNEAVRRNFADAEADRIARAADRAERFCRVRRQRGVLLEHSPRDRQADRRRHTARAADSRRPPQRAPGPPRRRPHRHEHAQGDLRGAPSRLLAEPGRGRRPLRAASLRPTAHSAAAGEAARRSAAAAAVPCHRVEAGCESAERHANLILDLEDEIRHWERVIEEAKARGVKLWERDDFCTR